MFVEPTLLTVVAVGVAVGLYTIAVGVADAVHALPRIEPAFWGLTTPAIVIAQTVDADENDRVTAGRVVAAICIRGASLGLIAAFGVRQFWKQADRGIRTSGSSQNHE